MVEKVKILILNEFYIKLVLIIITLLGMIPTEFGYLMNRSKKLFLFLGLFLILVLLVKDIKRHENNLLKGRRILLALWAAAYAVTIVLNFWKPGLSSEIAALKSNEIKQYLYTILFFFVMTYVNPEKTKETVRKEVTILCTVLVVVLLGYSLFGLYTFINNIYYEVISPWSRTQHSTVIGIKYGRLYGFVDPNTGITLSIIAIMASLLLLNEINLKKRKSNGYLKTCLIINMILQYIYLVLTQSRTGVVTFAVFAASYVIFRNIRKFNWKVFVFAAICFILPVKGQNIALNAIVNTRGEIAQAISERDNGAGADSIKEESLIMAREDTGDSANGGVLNGRGELWSAGFKVIKKNPVFGVSSFQVASEAKEYITSQRLLGPLEMGGLHNGYLMVWAASGTVGLILYLLYFGSGTIMILKALFLKLTAMPDVLSVFAAFIVSSAAHEMAESLIMFGSSFLQVLFWVIWGYGISIAENKKLCCDTISELE